MKKLRLEEITEDLGGSLLKELSTIVDLPKYGVVAGQSVASLIMRRMGIQNIGTPINDVDIFIPISPTYTLSKELNIVNRQKIIPSITEMELTLNPSDEYNIFGVSINKKYRILESQRVGYKNNIYIEMLGRFAYAYNIHDPFMSYETTKRIVEDFDMNSVQCGVDIVSKKLYVSKSFLMFLKNLHLKITNYKTPIHSIIRLYSKKEELGIDAETEFSSIVVNKMIEINSKQYEKEIDSKKEGEIFELEGMGILENKKNIRIEQPFVFNMGNTYYEKYKKIQGKMKNTFNIKIIQNEIYNTYGLESKEPVLEGLDAYIDRYIRGDLYHHSKETRHIDKYMRMNMLLKNLPNIIKRTIVHKDYYFMSGNNKKESSIGSLCEKGRGYRKFLSRVVEIPENNPPKEIFDYVNRIYDKKENQFIFNNMNTRDVVYWNVVLHYIRDRHGLDLRKSLKKKNIILSTLSLKSLVEVCLLEDLNVNILEIESLDNEIKSMLESPSTLRDSLGEHSLIVNNMTKKYLLGACEYKIMQQLESMNIMEIESEISLNISKLLKNRMAVEIIALILRKREYNVEDLKYFFIEEEFMKNEFLLEILITKILKTKEDFELLQGWLSKQSFVMDRNVLNLWLIKNKNLDYENYITIVNVVVDDLNEGNSMETLVELYEEIIIQNKGNNVVINNIMGRLRVKKYLSLVVELLNGEIDDHLFIDFVKTTNSKEVDGYIKNEDLKDTLNGLDFY